MATTAGRGILALGTLAVLLLIGVVLALLVDPFTRMPIEVDGASEWVARVLLVLAVAWVVIGMLAARTRLVGRPGAAAARATWIASTRPWRARESTLGVLPLDRWFMILIPGFLLVATRIIQARGDGVGSVVLAVAGWLVFALAVRLLLGTRSPWPIIAAVGGALVLRCIVTLAALSFSGPEGVWPALWSIGAVRVLYLAIVLGLVGWVFVVAGWSLEPQLGRRRAAGVALAGVGAVFALPTATAAAIGATEALRGWNSQIGVLPWHLARMTGLYDARFPTEVLVVAAVVAALMTITGIVLALPLRAEERRRRVSSS
ncbi:MAG: hypothetical protein IJO71_11325 [Microbacterium sp.]|uniref:hypothetical protein n=1 Tax=Microbacterium sp. TaxID=51671 RepID=UPI0025CE82C6|nr:hypothetical protein [Microbacterium sp.]MBQ9917774.1 hypothetical protein [Microbacterium sp.]